MSGTLFDECREGDGNFLFGWEVNPVPVREGGVWVMWSYLII